MSHLSSKSTSSFSVNVPQSVLFSNRLVSLSENRSRLQQIESELEGIFGVEKMLTSIETMHLHNMNREIAKINEKYASNARCMTPIDALRLTHFQDRIDAMYADNEPTEKEFIYAESLMIEKENLLLQAA